MQPEKGYLLIPSLDSFTVDSFMKTEGEEQGQKCSGPKETRTGEEGTG